MKGPAEPGAPLTKSKLAVSLHTFRIGKVSEDSHPPCAPDDRFCPGKTDVPVNMTKLSVAGQAGVVECQWTGSDPVVPDGSSVRFVEDQGAGKAFWFQDRRIECAR